MKPVDRAREFGALAASKGHPITSNPYERFTLASGAWMRAWERTPKPDRRNVGEPMALTAREVDWDRNAATGSAALLRATLLTIVRAKDTSGLDFESVAQARARAINMGFMAL